MLIILVSFAFGLGLGRTRHFTRRGKDDLSSIFGNEKYV